MQKSLSQPSPKRRPSSRFPSDEELRRRLRSASPAHLSDSELEPLLQVFAPFLETARNNEARLFWFLKNTFGQKTERMRLDQLPLFGQNTDNVDTSTAEEQDPSAEELEHKRLDEELAEKLKVARQKKKEKEQRERQKSGGRRRLSSHVPTIEHWHEEGKHCQRCDTDRPLMGYETSTMLELVPAHMEKHLHHRAVYGHCQCPDCKPVRGALPEKPIEKGLPGFGLLSHVLVSRFYDHIPFNHLSGMYGRLGVPIGASTLGLWTEEGSIVLNPLYEVAEELLLKGSLVGVDDTRMLVLDREKDNNRKRGHIWCYVAYEEGKPGLVYYRYTPDWKGERPREFVKDRELPMQADAYAGMDPRYHRHLLFSMAGCWAHGRRKFVYAVEAGELSASPAVALIKKLYEVEELARLLDATPGEVLALRKKYSVPLMDRLKRWREEREKAKDVGVLERKALTYLANQWEPLQRYLRDGQIPIDNTEVERRIRPVARARRLHLFSGSDEGAERMALMYTLMVNCQMAAVDPQVWLEDVLRALVRGWPAGRMKELLPQHWTPNRAQEAGTRPPSSANAETQNLAAA